VGGRVGWIARLAATSVALAGLVPVGWAGTARSAASAPLQAAGLEFSDEEGGVVLRDAFGSGTPEDPITLVEDITEDGPAVVTVRGMRTAFGNRATPGHGVGFVLVKIVRNLTRRPWHSFEMELREIKTRTSTFEDGLSFGQAMGGERVFGSDRFDAMRQTDEPLDSVVFSGAIIQPGESVTVRVVVTDFSPNWQFYLLQRRDAPIALLPDAASAAALP
jgi:hypothetical protein